MGRFLRIFFGCHARPDRSFYWNGKPFPICARCTGELAGMIAGIPLILLWGDMKLRLMILFYASYDSRRFFTAFYIL